MKHIFLVLAALSIALSGCSKKTSVNADVSANANVSANAEVIRDAISGNLQGWRDGSLPEAYWPEAIKTLKPIRIYSDRVNRVIVLSQKNGFESGYYVYIPISSHLPSNNQEWSFSNIGENIWTYTRKIGEQDGAGQPATAP